MQQIKQTHAQLITTDLISHPVSATKFLKHVALTSLSYAHKLFDQFPQSDLFIYNTMIKAHSLTPDSCRDSLMVFRLLTRDSDISPNQYSFVFAFSACGNGLCVKEGEQVRSLAVKVGLENNVFVVNALIGMYGKWGLAEDGWKVFELALDRDLYTWNTMIAAYVGSGNMNRARELFDGMRERDVVSWSSIIAGYVQVLLYWKVRQTMILRIYHHCHVTLKWTLHKYAAKSIYFVIFYLIFYVFCLKLLHTYFRLVVSWRLWTSSTRCCKSVLNQMNIPW